jgi:hypothetical protein
MPEQEKRKLPPITNGRAAYLTQSNLSKVDHAGTGRITPVQDEIPNLSKRELSVAHSSCSFDVRGLQGSAYASRKFWSIGRLQQSSYKPHQQTIVMIGVSNGNLAPASFNVGVVSSYGAKPETG